MKNNFDKVKILLFFVLLTNGTIFSQVVINEYSASNLTEYLDNYNKTEDWIELYNTSATIANIGGYYLSDDNTDPMKWEIPSGTTIPANGFLRFWTSGRDEVSGNNYHTNFKLKQTKTNPEFVVFTNTAGTIINEFQLQITQVEHSMGRETDGSNTWKIFPFPTNGASNLGTSYLAYAQRPVMSQDAGFYTEPVSVELSTSEPNSNIYYTVNGELPTASSTLYTSPVLINSTQILKAICISNDTNILPSFLSFNTFFIDTEHSLPVLSTSGNEMIELLNGNSSLRPHGTFEYFKDGERKDFGYGEYNKHGQDSWALPQRSYDYIARDEMGYHEAIKYKMLEHTDREEFQRVIIRACGDDNYPGIDSSAHMRDVFIQKFANINNLNLDMRRGDRCVSYVNGNFWGVYSTREKVTDSDYTDYYYDQDKYHIYYLMLWGNTWAEYGGTDAFDDWNSLRNYILTQDMTDQSKYEYVTSQYDVTSLVDYILINSFVVCTDWINWNVGWWRGIDPAGSHQKWGYILWDEDATFNHYINYTGVPDETPYADPCYPEYITADPEQHIDILNKLLDNENFTQYYVARYQDLMNTVFIADELIPLLETIEDQIAPEMPKHIDRWGGNITEWQDNVQKIKDFITTRETVIPDGLNDCYTLTGPYNISVSVEPYGAGGIQFNSVELSTDDFPWSANYHGGMNMLMKAVENNSGYTFDHWELDNHTVLPNSNESDVTVSLTQNDVIKAVYTPSTTTDLIVINEINYNSDNSFETGDWIELYNNGSSTVDISNWVFKDEDNSHEFIIPNGTSMPVDSYLVLSQDLALFQSLFPGVNPVLGSFTFGLSGGGELIRLFDDDGSIVDEVTYDDEAPWPTEPDGNGPTLELTSPNLDNSLAASWHASNTNTAPHGTPGALNSSANIGYEDLTDQNATLSIYPNPMGEKAIIRIGNQTGNCILKIYNLLGEEVGSMKLSTNKTSINKGNLSSGIYICKLFSNDTFSDSKKLIIK